MSIKLSVVCPFFNEEQSIVSNLVQLYDKLVIDFNDQFELIFVDDGSTDQSRKLLMDFLKTDKNLTNFKLIGYSANQGRGRALKHGIDAAEGDIIITTESDLSWGKDIILKLYKKLNECPEIDLVIASTNLNKGGYINVPLHRVFLSRVGNWLISKAFLQHVTMNTGMTRAYRKETIQPLITERDGKEFHLEVLLKLTGIGFRVAEIPATITWPEKKKKARDTPQRKSSTKLTKTIYSHLSFIVIARPLRLFSVLAFGALFLSVVALFAYVFTGNELVIQAAQNLFILAIIFTGFVVQFFQTRELLRRTWMQHYDSKPPSKRKATLLYKCDKA